VPIISIWHNFLIGSIWSIISHTPWNETKFASYLWYDNNQKNSTAYFSLCLKVVYIYTPFLLLRWFLIYYFFSLSELNHTSHLNDTLRSLESFQIKNVDHVFNKGTLPMTWMAYLAQLGSATGVYKTLMNYLVY
jgi:hypothetical protein